MNIRRKNRLWIACAVLAGLALTIGLVLYALRSNIDLFYTPGEILYGKRETQQMPEVGQRLRVGGMVMPGSVQRDPNSLKVTFTIYFRKDRHCWGFVFLQQPILRGRSADNVWSKMAETG